MSLTLTGPISFETANNTLILNNQSTGGMGFLLRVPSAGAAQGVTQLVAGRVPGIGPYSYVIPNVDGITYNFTFRWYLSSGYVFVSVNLNLDQTYQIVASIQSGQQTLYVNGSANAMGTSSLSTANNNVYFGIGGNQGTTTQVILAYLWAMNGYSPTQQDAIDLTFRTKSPSQIGSPTWFGEWSLDGLLGYSPQLNDPGLACSDGVHTITTISVGSGGSALYSAPLTVFNNTSIQIDPRSATVVGGTAGEIFDPRNTRIVK